MHLQRIGLLVRMGQKFYFRDVRVTVPKKMNLWGQKKTAEATVGGNSTLLTICLKNSKGRVKGCTRGVVNKTSLWELQERRQLRRK